MNIQNRYYRAVGESITTVIVSIGAVAVVMLAIAHLGNWLVGVGIIDVETAKRANLAHNAATWTLWLVPVAIYLRAKWGTWPDE